MEPVIQMNSYIRTKKLHLDLSKIETEVRTITENVSNKYSHILQGENYGWFGSKTAFLSKFYNLFEHNTPELENLLKEIRTMFLENFKVVEPLGIHGWANINKKGTHLKWHGHWNPEDRTWHGYLSVKSEPSTTTYNIPNERDLTVVHNKNNQLVISPSDGDRHCVSPWTEDYERISVAFDIVPFSVLTELKKKQPFSPFLSP
jgi:hypothetical protein